MEVVSLLHLLNVWCLVEGASKAGFPHGPIWLIYALPIASSDDRPILEDGSILLGPGVFAVVFPGYAENALVLVNPAQALDPALIEPALEPWAQANAHIHNSVQL